MSQVLVYTKICMCYSEKGIWTEEEWSE